MHARDMTRCLHANQVGSNNKERSPRNVPEFLLGCDEGRFEGRATVWKNIMVAR
jgi:hypothetical protein